MILGATVLADGQQHDDYSDLSEQQHDDHFNQVGQQHQDYLNQREDHHKAKMEGEEYTFQLKAVEARVTRLVNSSCGIGTLYSVIIVGLGFKHHLKGFTDDPCSYLEQMSPAAWIGSFTGWKLFGAQYASCVLAVIWICLLLLIYSATLFNLPKEAKTILSMMLCTSMLYKVITDTANLAIGGALAILVIPPCLMLLWKLLSLYDTLDETTSGAEMKRTGKTFEKSVKLIWFFQTTVLFLTCVGFSLFMAM